MKLYIFDKTSQRVNGDHSNWDKDWTPIVDYWRTYDIATQKAIVVDKNVGLYDSTGKYLQPIWDKDDNSFQYIPVGDLPDIDPQPPEE